MPFNDTISATHSRQEFCLAVKAARERKGITLDDIARTTKIPAYLFAGLEDGDLRRWPKGLFRRSFFRDYARVVGLPAETCADFVRLFPDEPDAEATKAAEAVKHAARNVEDRPTGNAWAQGAPLSAVSRAATALIDRISQMFGIKDADDTTERPEAAPVREWHSDARRVGPGRPRIRVRIKLPN